MYSGSLTTMLNLIRVPTIAGLVLITVAGAHE